jgi:uncharacterized protein YdeI (YjbR/CyaY-like superfamily)
MKMELTFTTDDRETWRRWLEEHGSVEKEVWFVYYKRETGKASVPYDDTVEEALCFGWIDSIIQKIDEEKYARKFTPRVNADKWSASNLQRMRKLIGTGRMTPAGLKLIDPELLKKSQNNQNDSENKPEINALLRVLKQHPRAWANFSGMAPSHQKRYLQWISAARQETTRQRRIEEAVTLLEQNQKLPLK